MALLNAHWGLISTPMEAVHTNSSSDLSSPENYLLEEGSSSGVINYPPYDYHFPLNLEGGYGDQLLSSNQSLLSFEQKERGDPSVSSFWEGSMSYNVCNNLWSQIQGSRNNNPPPVEDFSYFEDSGGAFSSKDQYSGGDWLYSEATALTTTECGSKRPHTGEGTQPLKKQCPAAGSGRKTKGTSSTPPKDPQSLAAKNRRERISERLKILQELVPNGTKVDLVTMLEKAISYVKFLQLQVKVLATDEFWPTQGGKAPDISQVKEAIDAILSNKREENSHLNQ